MTTTIDMPCPTCTKGRMRPLPMSMRVSSKPPIPHRCTKCGNVLEFDRAYPCEGKGVDQ